MKLRQWLRFVWTGAPPDGYDSADAWVNVGCFVIVVLALVVCSVVAWLLFR